MSLDCIIPSRLMKRIFSASLSVALLISIAQAHENHDHDAPTTLKAPKGGIIKALDEARIEVIYKGNNIQIFVYDTKMTPTLTSGFKILAKAELPRSGKIEIINLVAKDTRFEGSFDAKGSHRYTLNLAVTTVKTGRTDHLTFTIEPRR